MDIFAKAAEHFDHVAKLENDDLRCGELLSRMAAHQLRMGQALAFLLGGTTAAGMEKSEVKEKLGEQNHVLQRAIEESF